MGPRTRAHSQKAKRSGTPSPTTKGAPRQHATPHTTRALARGPKGVFVLLRDQDDDTNDGNTASSPELLTHPGDTGVDGGGRNCYLGR